MQGPWVEDLIFGTREAAEIDAAFDDFCRRELGAGVVEVSFRFTSVGVVRGVRLGDGRELVIKAHQPRESLAKLAAVVRVQRHLYARGFPAPEVIRGPLPFAGGHAIVERLLTGELADLHQPQLRRRLAQALARQIELARELGSEPALALGWNLFSSAPLWPPQAHSPLLDFAASAAGAEWIDALATVAKPLTSGCSELIIGHADLSAKNVRFTGDELAVIYDWDSLRLCEEGQIVGIAAMTHTAAYESRVARLAPDPDEVGAFIDEYAAARPRLLTRAERTQIEACALFTGAYFARCEHCYGAGAERGSFAAALRTYGDAYLRT